MGKRKKLGNNQLRALLLLIGFFTRGSATVRACVIVLVTGWQDQQQSFADRSGLLTGRTKKQRGIQGLKLRLGVTLRRTGSRTHARRHGAKVSRIKRKTCHGSILLSASARVKVKVFLCGVSAPRDEFLLFWQKEPKPCLPVRGPSDPAQSRFSGVPPPPSRIRWRRNSLCSNSLRREVDSGRRLRRARRQGDTQKNPNQSQGQESIRARNPNRLGHSPKNEPHTERCEARA